MDDEHTHAHHVAKMRDFLWEKREMVAEVLVLHTCPSHDAHVAALHFVGWKVNDFLVADLVNRRDLLEA